MLYMLAARSDLHFPKKQRTQIYLYFPIVSEDCVIANHDR